MWLWILIVCLLLLIAVAASAPWLWRRWRQDENARALRLFKLRREMLEAKFFDLASAGGKPRGLRWTKCDWQEEVRFARDVQTGLLTAFVAVEIHFEAIEGGEMEEVEAVGHFREASAVFHYQRGVWGTGGKALFNMHPADAVARLEGQYTPISS
jgi:hypothetical protein